MRHNHTSPTASRMRREWRAGPASGAFDAPTAETLRNIPDTTGEEQRRCVIKNVDSCLLETEIPHSATLAVELAATLMDHSALRRSRRTCLGLQIKRGEVRHPADAQLPFQRTQRTVRHQFLRIGLSRSCKIPSLWKMSSQKNGSIARLRALMKKTEKKTKERFSALKENGRSWALTSNVLKARAFNVAVPLGSGPLDDFIHDRSCLSGERLANHIRRNRRCLSDE